MNRIGTMALGMIFGSFLLYCGNGAVHGALDALNDGGSLSDLLDGALEGAASPGDGLVGDAHAQACCTSAPGFTKLAEGDVTGAGPSPTISVGNYREVVVYITASPCVAGVLPRFRVDAASPFGGTGQAITGDVRGAAGGRVRVDGPDMRFELDTQNCSAHYVVVGVSGG